MEKKIVYPDFTDDEEKPAEKDNQFALKYKPEYAEQVYDHMKAGRTISSFNVKPPDKPVKQKTVFAWLKDRPDFALAKELGFKSFLRTLETAAVSKAYGLPVKELVDMGAKKPDGEMIRFLLKTRAREEYSERQVIDHQGEAVTKVTFIEYGSREEYQQSQAKQSDGEEYEEDPKPPAPSKSVSNNE